MKNIIETMRKQGFSDEAIKHVFSRGNIIEGWTSDFKVVEQLNGKRI